MIKTRGAEGQYQTRKFDFLHFALTPKKEKNILLITKISLLLGKLPK
jgi:hypothetical protein